MDWGGREAGGRGVKKEEGEKGARREGRETDTQGGVVEKRNGGVWEEGKWGEDGVGKGEGGGGKRRKREEELEGIEKKDQGGRKANIGKGRG